MKAARYIEPHKLEVAEVAEPEPASGQALIEVATCGICGSDLHSFERGFAAQPGQVLGHEFTGTVINAPDVEGIDPGQRVTVRPLTPCLECPRCLAGDWHLCGAGPALDIGYGTDGAFAERVLVPRAIPGMTIFPLPASIGDRLGALTEPLSVSLRAVNLTQPSVGETAVVFGLGMIGLGAVLWLAQSGLRVIAVDLSAKRRAAAEKMGAELTIDPSSEDTAKTVASITGPGGYGLGAAADVIVECSGAAPAFGDALKCVRHGGRMSVAAMYPEKVTFRPDRFVEKEVAIQGSFAYKNEFPRVISMLEQGVVDAEDMISHTFGLDEIGTAFETQLDRDESLKVMVTP